MSNSTDRLVALEMIAAPRPARSEAPIGYGVVMELWIKVHASSDGKCLRASFKDAARALFTSCTRSPWVSRAIAATAVVALPVMTLLTAVSATSGLRAESRCLVESTEAVEVFDLARYVGLGDEALEVAQPSPTTAVVVSVAVVVRNASNGCFRIGAPPWSGETRWVPGGCLMRARRRVCIRLAARVRNAADPTGTHMASVRGADGDGPGKSSRGSFCPEAECSATARIDRRCTCRCQNGDGSHKVATSARVRLRDPRHGPSLVSS